MGTWLEALMFYKLSQDQSKLECVKLHNDISD